MAGPSGCLRCADPLIKNARYNANDVPTHTSEEQTKVEESVAALYEKFQKKYADIDELPELTRMKHTVFLERGLRNLSESYECLDASRPWICYWILHGLELMNQSIPKDTASHVAQFLAKCQCPEGGFAGGPGQEAHLAPTYAAVNALCILGTQEAFDVIDRPKLQSFLTRMRTSEGAFKMHAGGEEDIRGAYCAASAARLTNITVPEMFEGTAEWIVRCQTYEGGFGGVPGMEAHGGYSFCGVAALVLLGKELLCDMRQLLRWTANRQMAYEGGFQGRTNKLVDGCYSFWQGGAFPLIHMILSMHDDSALSAEHWMFHQGALQEYLLICCQHPNGGLIDKPGKPRDFYHTSYCLSGMSVAQHFAGGKFGNTQVLGDPRNELMPTHPVYNVGVEAIHKATLYFADLPVPDLKTDGATSSR